MKNQTQTHKYPENCRNILKHQNQDYQERFSWKEESANTDESVLFFWGEISPFSHKEIGNSFEIFRFSSVSSTNFAKFLVKIFHKSQLKKVEKQKHCRAHQTHTDPTICSNDSLLNTYIMWSSLKYLGLKNKQIV